MPWPVVLQLAVTLQEKDGIDNEGECSHDVGVVLELSEAQFGIVGMNDNVAVGEGDPEIPQVGEEVSHDSAKGATELCPVLGECHEVDGNGVFGGPFGCIENEPVFPSFHEEVFHPSLRKFAILP